MDLGFALPTSQDVVNDVLAVLSQSSSKLTIDYLDELRKRYPDRFDPNVVCDREHTPLIYRTCNQIICGLLCDLPLLLEGPPAAGKTTLVQYVSPLMDTRGDDSFDACVRYICHEDTHLPDLLGRWQMKQNRPDFVAGPLTKSVTDGHVLLLDELNLANHNSTIGVLVPLLDGRLLNVRNSLLPADRRFRLVACQNSVQLPGRKALKNSKGDS
jgi:midasin (ATPase involved in ribosome maturation)